MDTMHSFAVIPAHDCNRCTIQQHSINFHINNINGYHIRVSTVPLIPFHLFRRALSLRYLILEGKRSTFALNIDHHPCCKAARRSSYSRLQPHIWAHIRL